MQTLGLEGQTIGALLLPRERASDIGIVTVLLNLSPNLNKLHRQYLCFLIDSSDFVSGTDNKARLNGHIVS